MSASLVIDLGNTCQFHPSVQAAISSPSSGVVIGGSASGATVGRIIDLKDCNTLTNVWAIIDGGSGPVGIQVQTADNGSGLIQSGGGFPISGAFTDPTSGLAQLPTSFCSGGIVWFNSGLVALPDGGGASGGSRVNLFGAGTNMTLNGVGNAGFAVSGSFPPACSGGMGFAAFQRPHRYVRVNLLSNATVAPVSVTAGVLSQRRTTGSGGGFTHSPQGASVINV